MAFDSTWHRTSSSDIPVPETCNRYKSWLCCKHSWETRLVVSPGMGLSIHIIKRHVSSYMYIGSARRSEVVGLGTRTVARWLAGNI